MKKTTEKEVITKIKNCLRGEGATITEERVENILQNLKDLANDYEWDDDRVLDEVYYLVKDGFRVYQ